jgi:hypothetical protein
MFGLINARVYAVIAVITAAILYAIDYFDKNEAAVGWLTDQMTAASGSGLGRAISGLIVKPLIFTMDGPVGAILGGLLWPLLLVWFVLLLLVLSFAFIAPGVGQARCAASAGC